MRLRGGARVLGMVLLCGSLGASGYIAGWSFEARTVGNALVRSQRSSPPPAGDATRTRPPGPPAAPAAPAACTTPAPDAGRVVGLLEIPSLSLTAPVAQGESQGVLAAAIGHDPASSWPGEDGTAVFAAHDVSYFSGIDRLRPGAVIRYASRCATFGFEVTGSSVVQAGSPVSNTDTPTLVLDTCWPTDALWFTPSRLLVRAREVSVTPLRAPRSVGDARLPLARAYSVPVPAALAQQGLTIDDNAAPLGTLSVTGSPSPSFVESPEPLSVQLAALTAYFGGLHSLAQRRLDWWAAVAPGVTPPEPAVGASVPDHYTPLAIDIVVDGTRPVSVVLSSVVGLSGGSAPGIYRLEATCRIEGSTLVLSRWDLVPA